MNKFDTQLCVFVTGAALLVSSCGTFSRHQDSTPLAGNESHREQSSESPKLPSDPTERKIYVLEKENKQLQEVLVSMTSKLDTMTTEMRSLNEKIDTNQSRVDNLTRNQKAKPAPVGLVSTEGASALPPAGEADSESSFSSKAAVQKFREAMVLFEAHNYADSSLSFSSFVEQYPDHPLAGSAQFYLGESYFRQKQYKLAAKELLQVITSFDHSTHITDTLLDLADSEEKLGNSEDAAKHRQLLSSLFPHSPAGAALLLNPSPSEPSKKEKLLVAPHGTSHSAPHEVSQGGSVPEHGKKLEMESEPIANSTLDSVPKSPHAEGHEKSHEGSSNPFPMEMVPPAKAKALSAPVEATALDSPPPTVPVTMPPTAPMESNERSKTE